MARPKQVIWFETIMFATFIAGIIQTYVVRDAILARIPPDIGNPLPLMLGVYGGILILLATLTLFASRRRSRIALWILIALSLLGLPIIVRNALTGQLAGNQLVLAVQTIAQLFALALMLSPPARRWMAGRGPLDPGAG